MVYNIFMANHRIYVLGTTVPTRITPAGRHSGMDITIQNVNESGYIYLGGNDVTSTNYGYRLMPNHAISFELSGRDALYIVAELSEMRAAVIDINLESGH
jgi:hypothetical protein